ncbi:Uncharacterized protein OBRU01_21596, partial [Operophtera brumata]
MKKTQKSVSLGLFTPTCMALNTKERHTIDLQVQTLSDNPLFFYLCGILVGVFASFMVLVYYVSKLLPRRQPAVLLPVWDTGGSVCFLHGTSLLCQQAFTQGWTVGVYLVQQMWENIRNIVTSYQAYAFWYTLIVAFISFLSIGVLMIFFSSEYQEASAGVVVASLTAKYFPRALTHRIQGYCEEYYEEGARETKTALENLRKHCASPDCAQWSIMLKLNDSNRFASFVEGNSHLSDNEVMDYESYAFSMDRGRKQPTRNASRDYMEISDDDGTDSSDY